MKVTTTLATATTPEGDALVLQEHDGHYFMRVRGVQLMSTNASSSEQQMAELACADLPAKARVLIGGLGFGFTLRRVLELCPPDAVVDVGPRSVLVDALTARKGHVRGIAVEQLAEVGGAWAKAPLEKLARSGKGADMLEAIASALRSIDERTEAKAP